MTITIVNRKIVIKTYYVSCYNKKYTHILCTEEISEIYNHGTHVLKIARETYYYLIKSCVLQIKIKIIIIIIINN